VTSHGNPVLLPDLVLSVNSAADGEIARRILAEYRQRGLEKIAEGPRVRYQAPLFASITSTADGATSRWWRIARPGRFTDGHDPQLATHDLRLIVPSPRPPCLAIDGPDFGQNWHCIHLPNPANTAATPVIPIDLPAEERQGINHKAVKHDHYELQPQGGDTTKPHLQWIFQVSRKVIKNHNDIFNSRARSLMLALIQMSGAVASLARHWDDTFVPRQ
jgi:hypothetical protein